VKAKIMEDLIFLRAAKLVCLIQKKQFSVLEVPGAYLQQIDSTLRSA
jgi:hypothetical protein